MTDGSELRRRLFDLYSRNLALFESDGVRLEDTDRPGTLADFYLCPICMTAFHRDILDLPPEKSLLSLEHIPPRKASCGDDRSVVLTCKECNTTTGHKLEAHLAQMLKSASFLSGNQGTPVRTSLRTDEFRVGADWSIGPDRKMCMKIKSEVSSPSQKSGFMDALDRRTLEGFLFTADIKVPNRRLVILAILKSAYLILFSRFGYSYPLFAKAASTIRQQLKNPSDDLYPVELVGQVQDVPDEIETPSVSIIYEPDWRRSILVLLRIGTKASVDIWGVYLPGRTETADELYKRVKKHESRAAGALKAYCIDPQREKQCKILTESGYRHLIHEHEAWRGRLRRSHSPGDARYSER